MSSGWVMNWAREKQMDWRILAGMEGRNLSICAATSVRRVSMSIAVITTERSGNWEREREREREREMRE